MPECLTDDQKEFLVEQLLSEQVDEDTQKAVEIVAKVHTCGIPVALPAKPVKLPPAPKPPELPPPGERAYKTPRHKFMSECMRGEAKGGCGLPMKDCSEMFKAGKTEKPC
jgi:hypothetical protein